MDERVASVFLLVLDHSAYLPVFEGGLEGRGGTVVIEGNDGEEEKRRGVI